MASDQFFNVPGEELGPGKLVDKFEVAPLVSSQAGVLLWANQSTTVEVVVADHLFQGRSKALKLLRRPLPGLCFDSTLEHICDLRMDEPRDGCLDRPCHGSSAESLLLLERLDEAAEVA